MKVSNKANSTTSRSSFSGGLGYVLAVAGSAVGLGNIWRFPYLAAKYGGGIFLLVYLILMLTFGFSLMMTETSLGRMTRKSPVGAFSAFGESKWLRFGGWVNAIVPMIIIPYYSVIGGWVVKYLFEYLRGQSAQLAANGYFTKFIVNPFTPSICFTIFALMVFIIVICGVEKGIERVSKWIMPILLILATGITIYSVTRPGALEGVKYFFVPDFSKFSIMTVVTALGQLFFSLSLAMGILYTYGSYMKKDVDMEKAVKQIEIVDTGVAVLAGLMIIPAIFAFGGGQADTLQAGPALMFITIPKIFKHMGFGNIIGSAFFLMVLFAALTSAISVMEACVAIIQDQKNWSRKKSSFVIGLEMLILGIPCSLGFGIWDNIQLFGMSILDFFDFLSNSVLMPLAALCTCILVIKVVGFSKISDEIRISSQFKREKVWRFCIKYLSPVFLIIILLSSIANTLGLIKM